MEALLIIDMLNDFVHPEGVLFVGRQVEEVISFIRDLVDEKRSRGIPILYICDNHRPDDQEFALFPPHCVEGTWGSQVVAELAPREEDIVIPKRRFSAFFGTPLDLFLRERGITALELVGVCTNICVLYTCACARMSNYAVRVYRKGVTSFDLEAHAWALREMVTTLHAEVIEG